MRANWAVAIVALSMARQVAGGCTEGVNFSTIDIVCHVALLIENIAFSQASLVRLRLLEVVSCFLLLGYSWTVTGGNYVGCHFFWGIVGICINSYHLIRIFFDNLSAADMSKEMDDARSAHFASMSLYEFQCIRARMIPVKGAKRMKGGRYRDSDVIHTVPEGTQLITDGEPLESLLLVLSGELTVFKNGQKVATISACSFLGEISFFTNGAATATVATHTKCRIIMWNMRELQSLVAKHSTGNGHVAVAFQKLPSVFCHQLTSRVSNMTSNMGNVKKDYEKKMKEEKDSVSNLMRQLTIQRSASTESLTVGNKIVPTGVATIKEKEGGLGDVSSGTHSPKSVLIEPPREPGHLQTSKDIVVDAWSTPAQRNPERGGSAIGIGGTVQVQPISGVATNPLAGAERSQDPNTDFDGNELDNSNGRRPSAIIRSLKNMFDIKSDKEGVASEKSWWMT